MEITVTAEMEGKSVKSVLAAQNVSSTLLRRLKRRENGITLDGASVTVRAVVKEGQIISLKTEDGAFSETVVPQTGPLDIIFENESLLIINKPFGTAVHPHPGEYENTLANFVTGYYARKGEKAVFRPVNRLDKNTGGLLCVAKNAYAAALLGKNLSEKAVKRVYCAVLCGVLPENAGIINKPIGKCEGRGIKRRVTPDGEPAVTRYKVLARGKERTLAEIELETGRTHQIRVHFSDMGYPVWGDFMYGKEEDFRGHALFSRKIELKDPETGEKLSFSLDIPEWFLKLDDFIFLSDKEK
ncbi:MAG: RluA family pseudouridine synthase [Clostridia bacterium]|nr:RluA family pseudouridine synthase [Clostridia bacterium]